MRHNIKRATPADARLLAKLHRQEISEGFLSSLGEPFLSLLYVDLISAPDTACFVAEFNGKTDGFICACEQTSAFYRRFLRERFFAAGIKLLPRVVRPSIFRGILETLNHARVPGEADLPTAEILSLAVDRGVRRQGLGRGLVGAVAEAFAERGIDGLRVTTGADLIAANNLYRTIGFELRTEIEVHAGQKSNVYACSLERPGLKGGHAG